MRHLLEFDDPEMVDPKDFIMNRPRPKEISVFGRQWWRRGSGGTYFVADIYVDGELVHTLPMQGGYGEHYFEQAVRWLEDEGYIPMRKRSQNGGTNAAWSHLEELGIPYLKSMDDVKRQRDL